MINELIERMEKLEGPCRDCDQEIGIFIRNLGRPKDEPQIIGVANCPPYTESVNHALRLVPEGWGLQLTQPSQGPLDFRLCSSAVFNLFQPKPNMFYGVAVNLATALCIAILKMRQNEMIS